jgi:hypothetical protein
MSTHRSELVEAMAMYRAARRQFLEALGIPASNRDPLAEFSERLVAELVGGELAASRVEKGYDVIDKNGCKIQMRYLANPAGKWINEHLVKFDDGVDFYALVIVEALEPVAVIGFPRDGLHAVCHKLGKRHPDQGTTLQLTQHNEKTLLADRAGFRELGIRMWLRLDWTEP